MRHDGSGQRPRMGAMRSRIAIENGLRLPRIRSSESGSLVAAATRADRIPWTVLPLGSLVRWISTWPATTEASGHVGRKAPSSGPFQTICVASLGHGQLGPHPCLVVVWLVADEQIVAWRQRKPERARLARRKV
jgi:hypothetical protein